MKAVACQRGVNDTEDSGAIPGRHAENAELNSASLLSLNTGDSGLTLDTRVQPCSYPLPIFQVNSIPFGWMRNCFMVIGWLRHNATALQMARAEPPRW